MNTPSELPINTASESEEGSLAALPDVEVRPIDYSRILMQDDYERCEQVSKRLAF